MRLLSSLRQTLLAPPLAVAADRLLTWAEKGTLTSHQGWAGQGDDRHHRPSFAITYTAHVVITDFAGAAADVFFVVLRWLDRECPGAKSDAVGFSVDILDHKSCDLALSVEVRETVAATPASGGTLLTSTPDADWRHLGMIDGY